MSQASAPITTVRTVLNANTSKSVWFALWLWETTLNIQPSLLNMSMHKKKWKTITGNEYPFDGILGSETLKTHRPDHSKNIKFIDGEVVKKIYTTTAMTLFESWDSLKQDLKTKLSNTYWFLELCDRKGKVFSLELQKNLRSHRKILGGVCHPPNTKNPEAVYTAQIYKEHNPIANKQFVPSNNPYTFSNMINSRFPSVPENSISMSQQLSHATISMSQL